MATPIQSLTIDLDGTLLNTLPDLAVAANDMLRELGLPEHTEATIATFIGRGVTDLVTRCLPAKQSADVTFLAHALLVFRRHYMAENGRRTVLYPGVLEGLNAWKNAGMPMALVTNKAAAFTEPLLAATGLRDFFDLVLSGDSLPEKKPHPLPLLHACQHFGVKPENNLHLGDSRHDVQAARAAGCRVWLVPYGYNPGNPAQSLDCDAIVATLAEAAQLMLGSAVIHAVTHTMIH
jgi:phosphoglycolate phosphatase